MNRVAGRATGNVRWFSIHSKTFVVDQDFETTLLVVTHSQELAKKMDLAWALKDGKLEEMNL